MPEDIADPIVEFVAQGVGGNRRTAELWRNLMAVDLSFYKSYLAEELRDEGRTQGLEQGLEQGRVRRPPKASCSSWGRAASTFPTRSGSGSPTAATPRFCGAGWPASPSCRPPRTSSWERTPDSRGSPGAVDRIERIAPVVSCLLGDEG
ncbi:hypothetical protein GCM10010129_21800 [Streptomyces fumigatiscleroticus]|nr:hypothetical protein GCM10010129_21800 [Streptomyces fumigatiscleroticus]